MTAFEKPANLLVIVPCGKQKLWEKKPTHGPVEARLAYTGPYFCCNRRYAEHFGDAWFILSAKYGFIPPDFTIPCNYNVTFKQRTDETVSMDTLRQQVEQYRLDQYSTVVGLGGEEYREIITEVFAGRSVRLLFPFGTGKIGEKMRAVNHAIEANDFRGSVDDRYDSLPPIEHRDSVLRTASSADCDTETASPANAGSLCRWLHEQLEVLPLFRFPFSLDQLPTNGVYFLYENGENWGHGSPQPRIVRIGSHREGNFRTRLNEHFLVTRPTLVTRADRPAPKDRSIFRKHLGRALLRKHGDSYLTVWDIDFTTKANQESQGHLRCLEKESEAESSVTRTLRDNFSFRFILVDDPEQRKGLEGASIGTVAQCGACRPSPAWLGNYSPDGRIRDSGLWLIQHLKHPPLTTEETRVLSACIARTVEWQNRTAEDERA